jgi:hypothetical protein
MTRRESNYFVFRIGWCPAFGIQNRQCSSRAPGPPQQRDPPKLPTAIELMPAIGSTVSKGLVSDRPLEFSIPSAYIEKTICAGIHPWGAASLRMRQFGEALCGSRSPSNGLSDTASSQQVLVRQEKKYCQSEDNWAIIVAPEMSTLLVRKLMFPWSSRDDQ